MLLLSIHRPITGPIFRTHMPQTRKLWIYVARAFNVVDTSRLEVVGPNRLCAEWVLKNSGAVCFTISGGKYIHDYNALPPENVRLYLKEIDATNASIMKIGFNHLKGCEKIDKIIINNCKHLEDGGLEGLVFVKASLGWLKVANCQNLTDGCLMIIKELRNLKHLEISNLKYVKNIENVRKELSSSLPGCKIEIT